MAIEFKRNLLSAGTRKVPFREISFTTNATERTALYTGEGFDGDYQGLMTPQGMALFDTLFSQMVSDLMRIMVYNMFMTFLTEPSAYIVANMRFPYEAVIPDTPQKAFDHFFQTQFLALNKGPQMIHNIIAMGNRMFEAAGQPRTALLVMTHDVAHHIRANDETNLYFEDTGPSAVANRDAGQRAEDVGSIRGIEVLTIQMLGEDNNNMWNRMIFTDYVQTGSIARWIEPSVHVAPKNYKSNDRVAKWASWYAEKPEEHSPLDAWKHCVEFVPMDYVPGPDETSRPRPGSLDRALLMRLAREAVEDRKGGNGPFSRTRCRISGNQNRLHQFLHYVEGDGTQNDPERWFPILTFGEIHTDFLKDKHLDLPFGTMREAILRRLSEEEVKTIEEGLELASQLSNVPTVTNLFTFYGNVTGQTTAQGLPNIDNLDFTGYGGIPYGLGSYHGFLALISNTSITNVNADIMRTIKKFVPIFEKLVTVLLEINKNNVGLNPATVPSMFANASDFTKIAIAAWINIVSPERGLFILKQQGGRPNIHTWLVDGRFGGPPFAFDALGFYTVVRPLPANEHDFSEEAYNHYKGQVNNDTLAHLLAAPPLLNPVFERRTKRARRAPLWERIAQHAYLLQEVDLFGIESWWDNDVAVALGVCMQRLWEDMQTDLIVLTSEKEVGFTAFSGVDNILTFDMPSQHYECFGFMHFRTIVVNNKRFIVFDRVRGRRVLGGKGNRYVNSDPDSAEGSVMRVGTARFDEVVRSNFGNGEIYGQYGMLAVLDGYSNSIENPFGERHLPVTGYWDDNDFQGMLANSYAFQTEYDAPLAPNQFLLNMVFPEFINNKMHQALNKTDKPGHEDVSQGWRHNTHVHQITQWVRNPLTRGWDEINSSHPCGREEDGIREIQSSITPVRRAPRKPNTGLPPPVPQ